MFDILLGIWIDLCLLRYLLSTLIRYTVQSLFFSCVPRGCVIDASWYSLQVRMDPRNKEIDHDSFMYGKITQLTEEDMKKQESEYIYRYRYNGGGASQVWLGSGRYGWQNIMSGKNTVLKLIQLGFCIFFLHYFDLFSEFIQCCQIILSNTFRLAQNIEQFHHISQSFCETQA